MVSEHVKISLCIYAINSKNPRNDLISSEADSRSTQKKGNEQLNVSCQDAENATNPGENQKDISNIPRSEKTESETGSAVSAPKSLPSNFKVNGQQQVLDSATCSEFIEHISSQPENWAADVTGSKKLMVKRSGTLATREKDEPDTNGESVLDNPSTELDEKLQQDEDTTRKNDETLPNQKIRPNETKPSETSTSSKSPKSSQIRCNQDVDTPKPSTNTNQESRHNVQENGIKTSDMNGDSKMTRSETTMSSQAKQRRRAQRKADGTSRRTNPPQGRNRLEFDSSGRPKFKPSYEMVVDVAEFRFSRCPSHPKDDVDCDREHGRPVVLKSKSKKFLKLFPKKKVAKQKPRENKLWNTIDPEEHFVPSDSDEEPEILDKVPTVPLRSDVKSLGAFFKTRRNLKYGSDEKKNRLPKRQRLLSSPIAF